MQDLPIHPYLYDFVFTVTRHAARAVLAFLQRDSFIYWPFLVSTLIIAMAAWRFGYARGSVPGTGTWREFFQRYFGRSLWWHPSARVDYSYYLVNAVAFPLLAGPVLFTDGAVAGWLDRLLAPFLGPGAVSAGTAGVEAKLAYTLVFFVTYDFGRFVAHSLLHDVRFLWEFHKVHHSAEVLTPMTAFRAHPIDLAVMAWVPAVATGVVTWVFHRFVDGGIGFYTFLGLHAVMWAFNLIGNLRHWQVWISYGATLNRWLISPAHHQLHHSAEARHWGRNRGFELAVWDRLYGTLCVPANQPETFKMGLGDDTDGRWRSIGRLYFWPFALAVKRDVVPRDVVPRDMVLRDMVLRDVVRRDVVRRDMVRRDVVRRSIMLETLKSSLSPWERVGVRGPQL
ncbi:MAG: sterol desaturase family protein [Betaproteobacteria bacterium]|nr:sterol desaturase family protein [Betaproteobacteria bacterium]